MKSKLTLTLLVILTRAVYSVGNDVIDDIAVLQRAGFAFEKSDYGCTDRTIDFTVQIPPHYISDYGKQPFQGAAYIKPEDPDVKGPKLIAAKGAHLPLEHKKEKTGNSVRFSVLRSEAPGAYLEFTFNQGSGHPPMLVHVPLQEIVDFLTNPAKAEQSGGGQGLPSARAEEWPVASGVSPDKKHELVTIPIFDTDPPNETPYRIAFREIATKRLLDSFLWEGDIGDQEAHKQNKAFWSPDGRHLAIYMRSGRLSATTAYFIVDQGKLVRTTPTDVWQNVLGRFKTTKSGPNGGVAPVAWTDKNHLKVEVFGSADTPSDGRIPFRYYATFRFTDGHPYAYLESVEPVPENGEQ